jgi:hypothetical protein
VTGPGIDCGSGQSLCQATFSGETTLQLTAVPDAGYMFTGWKGMCDGERSTTVAIEMVHDCAATFAQIASAAPRTLLVLDGSVSDPVVGNKHLFYSAENSHWSAVSMDGGRAVQVRVRTSTPHDYVITLAAPTGQVLAPGTYENAGAYPTATGAALLVSQANVFSQTTCSTISGRFLVHDIALAPDGSVLRFTADVEQTCSSRGRLFAAVRFNSTSGGVEPFGGTYPIFQATVDMRWPGPQTPGPGAVVMNGQTCRESTCRFGVSRNATVTVTAVPDPGFKFVQWFIVGATPAFVTTPTITRTATQDLHFIADFRRIHNRDDFDGDGNPDLLWHHRTTGALVEWIMHGTSVVRGHTVSDGLGDTKWQPVGSGDFNADGNADFLWQHQDTAALAVWYTRAATAGDVIAAPGDPNWRIASVNDFNGDGYADLLWRNRVNGLVSIWEMNGTALSAFRTVGPSAVDLDWQIAGTADFNRDGRPDVLWRHRVTGGLLVWLLSSSDFVDSRWLSPSVVEDRSWAIAALPDINKDGHPDLVWQHLTTGGLVVWLMDGVTVSRSEWLNPSSVGDTNWRIVGPR